MQNFLNSLPEFCLCSLLSYYISANCILFKKPLCKTNKSSSEKCLLNFVFLEPSSSCEQYFLFMKRWSYSSPHKFSLWNNSYFLGRGRKKTLNRVWRKLSVMNNFRKSWAFEILVSASHFGFVLLPKWICISH